MANSDKSTEHKLQLLLCGIVAERMRQERHPLTKERFVSRIHLNDTLFNSCV